MDIINAPQKTDDAETLPDQSPADPLALTLTEYQDICYEIENQPKWRHVADKEMDYADGNQLDSELLRKMQAVGIPPAVENLIGPAMLAIQGYETAVRSDWRVTANAGDGQEVADAINFRLNEAERESKADQAMSDAFRPQAGCGLGWVEVSRNSDPFGYPFRCTAIHRSEIFFDFKSAERDLSDARWMIRQRWLPAERIAMVFPDKADLIRMVGKHGANWWGDYSLTLDGGQSTGLSAAWGDSRDWTIEEDRWYNPTNKDICLAEVWYRRWTQATLIKTPDGRLVEYDETNPMHDVAIASGRVQVIKAIVARVRRSYWIGPYCLYDGPTPYVHRHFPYVPFWGFREDNTRVPFGFIRDMIYQQDSLNSGVSKLRWGMSVVRVERTEGAVAMTDDQLRRQVARPDADIKLDRQSMNEPGARFEIKRDYQLTDQHFAMLNDNRSAIQRTSGAASAAFQGRRGTATSGVQEQQQVEQANQSLATMIDNFRFARKQVGELLMSMIVQDMGDAEQTIVIQGDAVHDDKTVIINQVTQDDSGQYLNNDLQRTRLKVALEDVPSTNSYRGQQLNAMSEAVKSLPAQYQAAVLPYLVSLMDVPFQREVVQAIRDAAQQPTAEGIQAQIDQAVQAALAKSGADLKSRELDIKERESDANINKTMAQAVQIGVQAAFSAMQGGAQVAAMPPIAPIADAIMKGAGYQRPNPAGDNPNFPTPDAPVPQNAGVIGAPFIPVHQNTSPEFPPVPQQSHTGETGIETATTADNFGRG